MSLFRPGIFGLRILLVGGSSDVPQFPLLFSPIQIRNKTIKNRIASTAHVTIFTENGMPADRERRYYIEKAKGGAGMLICFGVSSVHPTSPALDWKAVELFMTVLFPSSAFRRRHA